MNKFQKILIPILGILCLYCTFIFIFDLQIVADITKKYHLPYFLVATLIIITSGVGVELGSRLILGLSRQKLVKITMFFSIYMFIIQFFITTVPGFSACNCISFSENLIRVLNWSRVEYSFIFTTCSLFCFFTVNKNTINHSV